MIGRLFQSRVEFHFYKITYLFDRKIYAKLLPPPFDIILDSIEALKSFRHSNQRVFNLLDATAAAANVSGTNVMYREFNCAPFKSLELFNDNISLLLLTDGMLQI